jgi:hypothetical protein
MTSARRTTPLHDLAAATAMIAAGNRNVCGPWAVINKPPPARTDGRRRG